MNRRIGDDEDTQESPVLEDFADERDERGDATRRGMVRYRKTEGNELQFRRDQMEVNEQVADELKELRRTLAKVVKVANIKASKGEMRQLREDLEKASDKRMDTIRNWLIAAITMGGFIVTLLRALK